MAAIGDLDGDGITDLAVGAYGDNTGGADRGALYVLFMNSDGRVKSSQKIASGTGGGPTLANSDKFGSSVTSLGDLDGDGVTDLAVGAIYDDTGGTNRGAVLVLFMNSNGTVKSFRKIASGQNGGPTLSDGDQFGASVAAVGDLDGDGVTDLAVGANYDDTGGTSRGAIYLLFMNSDGRVKSSQKIANGTGGGPTLNNDDRFGVSVASMGDLDGDGLTDLAVGANFDDTGGINRGAVYTLYLKAPAVNANPVFTSPNTANVPENATAVMTVTATDSDVPAQAVTFSIVGGADQAKFSITSGGALSFASAPDFEAPADANGDNIYEVTVEASDGAGGTAMQTINVTVTPVNDNNPVFTSADTASVPENTTAVMTVTATDADSPSQLITFSIVGGADESKFDISIGGALSFISAPDFEMPTDSNGDNVYVVTVRASDGAGGTTLQTINVTVTSVNDNDPVFTSPDTANIAENTTAVMTVTATDADLPIQDGKYFSSEIIPGAPAGFVTNDLKISFTGQYTGVQLLTPVLPAGSIYQDAVGSAIPPNAAFIPVFPTLAFDTFVAQGSPTAGGPDGDPSPGGGAVDLGGAPGAVFTSSQINQAWNPAGGVTITDRSDFLAARLTLSTQVNSSFSALASSGGSPFLIHGSIVDGVLRFEQKVTFSIAGGADGAKFSIARGGALSFISAPDFEMPADADGDNVYEVTVQASDGNGGTTLQTINVTVTPVNDNNPAFTSPDTANVAENTTAVMTVTATDADLPPQGVTFSIVGGADQSKFGLTSGGVLTFNSAPDFEAPTDSNGDNVYVVTVEASDGEGGTKLQTINVTVTPVNDNNPVFTSPATVNVAENTTSVMTVTATDADNPEQTLTYSISAIQESYNLAADWSDTNNPNGPWSYNDVDGLPLPAHVSDWDLTDEHFAGPQPAWSLVSSPRSVPMAFKSVGVTAGTFWNLDAPSGTVGMHGQPLFAGVTWASPDSGLATISGGVWKMRKNNDRVIDWRITVNGSVVTEGALSDSDPYTSSNPFDFASGTGGAAVLSIPVMPGDVIGIDAGYPVDPFHSDFVGVDFSISLAPDALNGADQSAFEISPDGVLSFKAPPDFEAPADANGDNVYEVVVQADDGNGGTTTQTISVTVTAVNDNSPVFTSPNAAIIPEKSTAVMNVTATDADLPAQAVTYSIAGGADQAKFGISSGGVLSFLTPPNYAMPTDAGGDNTYEVIVEASDGNGGTTPQTINVSVTSVTDYGDAPDLEAGSGRGEYNTRFADNGPSHTVVTGLQMGASVDADSGALQNAAANADDVDRGATGRRRWASESNSRFDADGWCATDCQCPCDEFAGCRGDALRLDQLQRRWRV